MYLLFDIGGTKMRLAVSADGVRLSQVKIMPTPEDFSQGIAAITAAAQSMAGSSKVTGAAGGAPGPLNEKKSFVTKSPNLPRWSGQPLQQALSQTLHCPVALENDAALAGLGEATVGAGQGQPIVSYLTVSTGLGGSRIVNGVIDEHARGFEPGHQIVAAGSEVRCTCGALGHLEGFVSGAGLKQRFGQAAEDITDAAVWQEVVHYLAIGLHNVAVYWSPHCIILGGSVMRSIRLDQLQEQFAKMNTIFSSLPNVTLAQLGEESGLQGALAHARYLFPA